ncbi:MAG: hypothetical protein WDZ28_01615 [Simkaniaceae bacterium]
MLTLVAFIDAKSTVLGSAQSVDLEEANALLATELLVGFSFVVLAGVIITLCFFSPLPLALIITFYVLAGNVAVLGAGAILESLGRLLINIRKLIDL